MGVRRIPWVPGLLVLATLVVRSAPALAQDHGDGGAAGAPGAQASPADAPTLSIDPRKKLHRGSVLSVKGTDLASLKDVDVTLMIGEATVGTNRVAAGTTALTFSIPFAGQTSPALGSQPVRLVSTGSSGKSETRELGYVEIVPLDDAFEVQGVQPAVAYPKQDTYELTVTGRGFGEMGQDHALFIGGREVAVCWPDSPPEHCRSSANATPPALTGTRVSDRELRFEGLPASAYHGQYPVQLRLGNGALSAPRQVVFASWSRALPSLVAAGMTLVLFVVIVWLCSARAPTTVDGFKVGRVAALFLDKETGTYSLSRFQVYAWTGASIFAYAFLALARTFVQGKVELPEVPGSLPGIVAISVGTSIASVGITSTKGPKGTGPIRPSLADFISSGGVVAPERFQLLAWTVIGVLGFLLIVVSSDPAVVTTLPTLPDGLLYLSGVSAFGYLGGKMARKPGPVIDSAVMRTHDAAPRIEIDLVGRNLSADAKVTLQGVEVGKYLDRQRHPDSLLAVSAAGNRANLPEGSVTVRIALTEIDSAWQNTAGASPPPALLLKLANADGQFAEAEVDISPADAARLVKPATPPSNAPGAPTPNPPAPAPVAPGGAKP